MTYYRSPDRGGPGAPDELPPLLDTESISFPSDRLSFGTLRKVHPELFDGGIYLEFFDGDERGDHITRLLAPFFHAERVLAEMAFDGATGKRSSGPDYEIERREWIEELAEDYIRYGLAAGMNEVVAMVSQFEAQARAQGRRGRG